MSKEIKITREDILRIINNPKINDFKYKTTYAEIEGRRYSVKGLLSLAIGLPTNKFSTLHAEKILSNLGFKVVKVKEGVEKEIKVRRIKKIKIYNGYEISFD
ncbi:MAG: hypothetical protein QXI49_06755 [Candidatus Methanomethylicaceae archaeon]